MYKRLAEKITKLIIAALQQERLLDMAAKGEARPAKAKGQSRKRAGTSSQEHKLEEEIRKPHLYRPSADLEGVVQSMLAAHQNPALRSQANRALNAYSKKRAVEIKSTPKRVVAGVRASVTKRRQKAAG
jgi:hypothetical protein